MQQKFLQTAALMGAIAVILGAFGAHALKQMLSEKSLGIFETAVRYQLYHVFALLVTGILYREFTNNLLLWAGRLFITGIVLFSGSLYVLTFINTAEHENFKWIGAITPLGGVCFIVAWILIFVGVTKKN